MRKCGLPAQNVILGGNVNYLIFLEVFMKTVLLIGMGKFGQTLGEKLINMGDEVMIVEIGRASCRERVSS